MYILEGNIGAGKTTFLKLLTTRIPYVTVGYEPVDDWQHCVSGQSLLTSFYKEPRRWAYTMETFAMLSRVREHIRDQAFAKSNHIIERSIYSGHYVFSINSYRNGFLTPLEWHLYSAWFSFLIPQCRPPRGFIYLRVSPAIAFERLKKRARSAEASVGLEYLEQLHQCHDDFLLKKQDVLPELKNVPVLVLDCDIDFETHADYFDELVNRVQKFLDQTA